MLYFVLCVEGNLSIKGIMKNSRMLCGETTKNGKHKPVHNVAVVDVGIINVMLVKDNVYSLIWKFSFFSLFFRYFLGQLMILITTMSCYTAKH